MTIVLVLILVLFTLGLILRKLLPRLCAICFAISATWLYGLIQHWDPLVLAMLMGGSAVGLMYYLGSKFPKGFGFFKLPYLLTTLLAIQLVLTRSAQWLNWMVLGVVWVVFIVIYSMRNGAGKTWFHKVVECCRNW